MKGQAWEKSRLRALDTTNSLTQSPINASNVERGDKATVW